MAYAAPPSGRRSMEVALRRSTPGRRSQEMKAVDPRDEEVLTAAHSDHSGERPEEERRAPGHEKALATGI